MSLTSRLLAAATLLASPYVMSYDALVLALPIACEDRPGDAW